MPELLEPLRVALADRYTIERELGRGATATVYLAQDLKHRRQVAIKVLRSDLAAVIGPERFLREIEIVAGLSHPHILPLHDSGEAAGFLYYVMPWVEGESLRQRLTRESPLPLDEALRITREVADALGYAHRHHVIHRDIKPENILLSDGHALVADFGIARALSSVSGPTLTDTGLAMGTPAYMSPEQAAASRTIDGRTDVYALGCVLYELLTGHPPFLGSTAQEVLARHTLDPIPPLRTARPELPASVERAVRKALAKSPADRFSSPDAFSEALSKPDVPPALTRRTLWSATLGAALVMVIIASYLIWERRHPSQQPSRSIAVLPFVNLSGDRNDEYLSDGIADELGTALHRVVGLRVVGWTSASRFRNRGVSMKQIGAELNVGSLLDATIRRSGNRIRVHAQLINANDGFPVWSDEYERDVNDAFAVQDEISRAIVGQLRLALGSSATSAPQRAPVSSEAYDLYLRGRYFFGRRGADDLRKSVEYFEQAIRADSSFAAAYAGLSDVYSVLTIFGYLGARDGFPKARGAALKALELDSTLAEAHTSLGIIHVFYDWDQSKAERELSRAITLDPQNAQAHLFRAWNMVWWVGDTAGAILEAQQARQLDPLSPLISTRVGTMFYLARRYGEAVAQLHRSLELDSLNPLTHAVLAQAYLQQRRCDLALGEGRFIPPAFPNYEGAIATGYAKSVCGRRSEAIGILRDFEERSKHEYIAAGRIALMHLGLGAKDSAIAWLGRSFDQHETYQVALARDPVFDALRTEAGFMSLMSKIGLSP